MVLPMVSRVFFHGVPPPFRKFPQPFVVFRRKGLLLYPRRLLSLIGGGGDGDGDGYGGGRILQESLIERGSST